MSVWIKKVVFLALMSAIMIKAGCERNIVNDQGAVRMNRDTRFYNDYLGVSYSIPRGWWVYDVNEYNFSRSKGEISDNDSMDIGYFRYENYLYSDIWLISFANLENSTLNNHLGFSLNAIFLNGISDMAGFMEYFEMYLQEPFAGEEYKLQDSQQVIISGKTFELRDFLVTREANNFHVLTLSSQIKHGYFFSISVDYWPDNSNARQIIVENIKRSIEFY